MDKRNEISDGLRLLSLDGGGPGSMSQLRIIEEYMQRLAHQEGVDIDELFPADLFDAIGGVGFGAYIAILIGTLRMPASKAIEELVILGTTLFPADQKAVPTPEENYRRLREATEDMIKRQELPIDIKLRDASLPGSHCKVSIFVTPSANTTRCIPLRTYASKERNLECTLVEAVCATLAILPFFSPVSVGPPFRKQNFLSASVGFGNVTREFLTEAAKQFGQERRVSTIISIGSGRPSVLSLDSSSNSRDYNNILEQITINGEKTARELSSQLFNVEAYLRLNVDQGLNNIQMTDWKDLGTIESHTDVYLQETAVSNAIDSSFQTLQDRVGLITLGQLTSSTHVQTQAKTAPAVSPYFVVRHQYWDEMEKHLIKASEAERKILVLSGMGGCGKTQMVAYFVKKFHSRYRHIFFIDASSHSSIRSDLQSAIRALGVGYEQKTFEDAVQFLKSGAHDGNWLLILDNADDPSVDIVHYLPDCFHGTVLITTRNPELGRLNTTVHLRLGPMGDNEACELLARAAHRTLPLSSEEDESAKQLRSELGCLAVALVQAGGYCYRMSAGKDESGSYYTFGQYLSLFKQHRKELMMEGDKTSLDRYTRGAYTTFDLSYTLLPQSSRELLHLSSFFHHTDISLAMFESAARSNFSDYFNFLARTEEHRIIVDRLKGLLCPEGRWNELSIHRIIHSLQSFSLVSTTSVSNTISLRFHPLVHTWNRDLLSAEDVGQYMKMARQIVVSCTSPSNVTFYQFLLSHMAALTEGDSAAAMQVNDYMGFGHVLLEMGYYSKAAILFQNALDIMETEVGKQDVDTIMLSEWLTEAYHREGKLDEAERMQVEIVEQRRRLLGEDHPDTITASGNLAGTYHAQGRWKEAEELQVEILSQQKKSLTMEHPDTLEAAHALAFTYYKLKKLKKAETMQVEVLETRRRILGKDHPDTLRTASHLARTYQGQGKLEDAERIEVEVLEQRLRVSGKEHPDTIMATGNLAWTYHAQKRSQEALELQTEVVGTAKRVLGSEHPFTLIYIGNFEDMRASSHLTPK